MAPRKQSGSTSRKTSRGSTSTKSGLEGGITDFSKDQELDAYREMLLIRRFEEKAGQLYGMGFIGGFCHLYIGQEAVVVGEAGGKRGIHGSGGFTERGRSRGRLGLTALRRKMEIRLERSDFRSGGGDVAKRHRPFGGPLCPRDLEIGDVRVLIRVAFGSGARHPKRRLGPESGPSWNNQGLSL